MKRTILHLGSMLLLFSLLSAQTLELTGRVVDPQGNPIPSVSVITNLSSVGTQTDSDGDFRLPFSAGVTRITFSSVGFQSRQFDLITVPDTVILQPTFYRERDIIITADRAREGVTPVPFENFSQDEIARDYTVGEFPLLLESTPNLYAYSDAGSSLGYSYLSIRGFNDKRVSVYINGVPLNDPEDQATYFVDLPDFAATVTDIQVQRGVGNSLYGDASFGGSVNIASNSFARERQATISTGYGQYLSDGEMVGEIAKQSVEYASGMIDGRWAFAGRFSKQKTGGYRHDSWYDGWAYYFALARLDTRSTTELQIYGGPMRMHLAYYGTSRADLNRDRRTNYLAYDNETDNFNQPHYQLHNVYHLSDKATLSNTLYYIHGRGYYEQLKNNAVYGDYNIRPDQVNIDTSTGEPYTEGDFVRQIWVEKDQYGWNPRLDIAHQRGRHTLGGSFYLFDSDHWGEVKFAENLNGDLASGHRYYRYFGDKAVGSIYAQEQYQLNDKLGMLATAQLRYQSYQFEQERMGAFLGYDYDVNWLFFSPRLGFTYALTDKVSLIANAAVSSRTPTDAEIYDANDPYAMPSLEVTSVAINGDDTTYTFGDPTAESERVINYELGGKYRDLRSMVGVNLFWMDFKNEIIPYGGINTNTGLPITTNAERSVHAGIELTGETAVTPELTLSGNWSLNYNRIREYVAEVPVYLNNGDESRSTIDMKDKVIPGFPKYLGNLIVDWHGDRYRVTWKSRFVGRQYMELYNYREKEVTMSGDTIINDFSSGPYIVTSLTGSVSWDNFLNLGRLTVTGKIDNLFQKLYESSGYGGISQLEGDTKVYGWAEYYVGAERNFFTQISLELF